jgi:GTPase
MTQPKIAIIGRPNVGKSALFNRICRKRIAIVDEAEGVTRDRLYAQAELFGRDFEVIDTGGIDARSVALFNAEVKEQAEIAIEEADGLILVVDGQIGPTDLDVELARVVLRTDKPIILAVNKVDTEVQESFIHAFYGLGVENVVGVSASQGRQVAELLQNLFERIPEGGEEGVDPTTRLAIIGRPNVGKSTLVNAFLDEKRCIVSPIAGTTRDSIDTRLTWNEKDYTLIDTAGIRRKKSEHEVVDKFAAIRTERALERADICVLMIDCEEGITTQDKRIATEIEEAGKGCVVFFNKWDTIKEQRMEHWLRDVRELLPFLGYCPVIFGSAKTGRNIESILEQVAIVEEERNTRITTGQLNKFLVAAMQRNHPPMLQGKRLRIYYMTQVGTAPPRFLLFVNYPKLMSPTYQRYLMNQFRETFPFTGNPLTFQLKQRERKSSPRTRDLLQEAVGHGDR